jgi:nitrite reductase/ring-hydroxylating ferredoxin subunit
MAHPHEPVPGTRLVALTELARSGTAECSFGPAHDPFRVVVFLNQGRLRAFENRCPHFSIPLNYEPGVFWVYDNATLMCAHHSAMFHLEDGRCFDGPCLGASLNRLAVEARAGAIWYAGEADDECVQR